MIKVPCLVCLPIMIYAIEIPFNSATLSYMIEKKIHTYQEKIATLNLLKKEKKGSAVTVVKSSRKYYIKEKLEIEFKVSVTLHRDIKDLIISDNFVEGFEYKDSSIRLNNIFPKKFKLLDRVVTIPIGDVKSGQSYEMRYIVKPTS